MQKFVITSGKWTSENFSGYTLFGERVHIFGHQMTGAGFSKEHTTFPFVVVAEKKSYAARLDAEGKTVGLPITDRLTATAVFANEDKFVEALATVQGFDERIEKKVARRVKALELDLEGSAA